MQIRTAEVAGKTFTVKVVVEQDDCSLSPWDMSDCHGVVDGWCHTKAPNQRILMKDRRGVFLYNMQESMAVALRDGWGHRDATPEMSKRQVAALAVEADFQYLKGYVDGEWWYTNVIVTLLDDDGGETDVSTSLGGVESEPHQLEEQIKLLIDELVSGYGTSWFESTRTTYVYADSKE